MVKLVDRRASVWVYVLILAALVAAGCGAPATPEPTPLPPTATQPPPTDTPVPEPTATPEPTAVPGPVTVADLVTYERPGGANDTVSITVPGASGGPYPWFWVIEPSNGVPSIYAGFTNELLARGYGVVRFSPAGWIDSAFCAWAWLEVNAPAYGLDLDRSFIYADAYGFMGALLALSDEAAWTTWLEGCGHPVPSMVHIRGVAGFTSWFNSIESLPKWDGVVGEAIGVTGEEEKDVVGNEIITELTTIPPEEWHTPGKLGANALLFAPWVPSYFLFAPDFDAAGAPPFLLLDGDEVEWPPLDSAAFAAELERAGVEVELVEIPGGVSGAPGAGSEWPVRIAEMVDEWAQKQLQ